MAPKEYSDAEIKLTAALYAKRSGVVDHIRTTGRLPDEIPSGGMGIAMQKLINRRGATSRSRPTSSLSTTPSCAKNGCRAAACPDQPAQPDQDSQDG